MSTAPQGWQNSKTNWQAADIVHPSDFNRIEGNIQAIETGQRTLDPSLAPNSNSGTLRQILSWMANRIRAITGGSTWYGAPATTLAAAKSHMDATSGIHGATSSATANRIIIRDSAGRAKVAAPSASDDIARKAEVDAVYENNIVVSSRYGGDGEDFAGGQVFFVHRVPIILPPSKKLVLWKVRIHLPSNPSGVFRLDFGAGVWESPSYQGEFTPGVTLAQNTSGNPEEGLYGVRIKNTSDNSATLFASANWWFQLRILDI